MQDASPIFPGCHPAWRQLPAQGKAARGATPGKQQGLPAISHARRVTGPEPQPGQQEHRPPRLPIFSAAYAYEIPRDAYALCVPFWPFLPS